MSKGSKQLPNSLQRAETNAVLIVLNDAHNDISAYTVTVYYLALHKSGTRKALLGP